MASATQLEIGRPSGADDLAFWRAVLEDAPTLLDLPTDRPRSAAGRGQAASLSIDLDAGLGQALRTVADRHDATLLTVLHAALALLLSRWSNQDDIVIATPGNGDRHSRDVLVLRTRLEGNPTIPGFLADIGRSDRAAISRRALPYEQLVAELHPDGTTGRPLQVMLVVDDGLVTSADTGSDAGRFELEFSFASKPQGGLGGRLAYDADLFTPATAERLVAHLQRILRALAEAGPQSRVADLDMLSPAERQQVVSQWNATAIAYPGNATIADMFEAQVARSPQAIALTFGDEQLSYAELNARANRLARRLIGLGAGPDTTVGVSIERSLDMIVSIIAILKAGAGYLPLDPTYPKDRLDFMVKDSSCVVVVVQTSLADGLPEGSQRILIDNAEEKAALAKLSDANPGNADRLRPLHPDCLAYVLYTSGSTGLPKGVCMIHRPLVNLLCWQHRIVPTGVGERTLQFTSINFDVSFQEIGATLTAGGTLVLIADATRRDPSALLEHLRRTRANRLFLPFAGLQALAEAAAGTPNLPEMRAVITAGEQLRLTATIRALFSGMPGCSLHNHYGPTESHVVTAYTLDDAPGGWQGDAPIGQPIDNTSIYVLDRHLKPVPVGVAGELYIGGVALARGYLNRQDLTAERFIDDPIGPPGGRLYKTGDLVRWRPDGILEYLGRGDQQVKIRGFRVEPGEVEAALLTHPSVAAAAVIAYRSGAGNRLAAYFVPGAETPSTSALRKHLAATLPDYMIPAGFIRLDTMPLTPSGKVNRRALPAPDTSRDDQAYRAPSTPREETLARIWAEVLGLEKVGVDDNFFEIGGDSILAFRISAAAKKTGMPLTPRDIASNPTVAALAALAAPSSLEASEEASTGEAPLSPMQRYYFSWAKPNPNKFNVGFIARTKALLDPGRLDAALQAVIRHHDALRLRFWKDEAGAYRQRFADDAGAYRVPIHRIKVPEGDQKARLDFLNREITRLHDSLDIEKGPLITAGLFDGGAVGEHHFFLAMHELITDAVSLQVTLEDLRQVYVELGEGRPVGLPARTTSYRRWIDGVIDYAREPAAAQYDYWLDRGRGASPFPEDSDTPGALQNEIDLHDFQVLDAGEVARLRSRHAGGFQSRLIHGIVAGLTLTAHRISGQRNLIFHKVAHGRETCIPGTDVSQTVGWFITHTPITVRLPDGPLDNADALVRVLDGTAEQYRAIPDNGLAHSALRYFSDDPRAAELAQHDQVKTLFQYIGDIWQENYDGELFLVPDAGLADMPDAVAAENLADYHLHVYAYMVDGCFRLKFFYTRRNYRPETVKRMGELFTASLRGMLQL